MHQAPSVVMTRFRHHSIGFVGSVRLDVKWSVVLFPGRESGRRPRIGRQVAPSTHRGLQLLQGVPPGARPVVAAAASAQPPAAAGLGRGTRRARRTLPRRGLVSDPILSYCICPCLRGKVMLSVLWIMSGVRYFSRLVSWSSEAQLASYVALQFRPIPRRSNCHLSTRRLLAPHGNIP